jgi:hypothetical protein
MKSTTSIYITDGNCADLIKLYTLADDRAYPLLRKAGYYDKLNNEDFSYLYKSLKISTIGELLLIDSKLMSGFLKYGDDKLREKLLALPEEIKQAKDYISKKLGVYIESKKALNKMDWLFLIALSQSNEDKFYIKARSLND